MGGKGRKQPGVLRRLLPKIHGCLRLLRFLVHSVLSSPSDPNRKVRRETRKEPKGPNETRPPYPVPTGFSLRLLVSFPSVPRSLRSLVPYGHSSRPKDEGRRTGLVTGGGREGNEGRVSRILASYAHLVALSARFLTPLPSRRRPGVSRAPRSLRAHAFGRSATRG